MVIKCEEVWREVSNYIDGDVEPGLRLAIEEHVRDCKHCAAVVDGTRNVVHLYADERMLEVPVGFSRRLHQRLEGDISASRRGFLGWVVAAATSALVLGGFELTRLSALTVPARRSGHAQASSRVPPDMLVIVSERGKIFHIAGCPFIHDKATLRTVLAREAEREGYAPCVRCMKKYLDAVG
ncbi:MAG TPA: zf-HC2 domain-containing protein [Terriglobales bacterium]|nr:zf-HC2 domain-containing protein [Terriglobales bacterium]